MRGLKHLLKYLLLLFSCFWVIPTWGQLYNFKWYGTKNGLANSNINATIQTSEGYCWFGTQGGGISRFDGKEFKNFTKNDGLLGNDVTALSEDLHHNLWVGTTEGLCKFDGKKFTDYTEKAKLKSTVVYSILTARNGDIWVGTFDYGIRVIRGNQVLTLDTNSGLPTNSIFALYEDAQGFFWIGTFKHGICKVDKNLKLVQQYEKLEGENTSFSVFSFAEDKKGKMWIGTITKGIFSLEKEKWQYYPVEGILGDIIAKIQFDRRGNGWAATEHGLLKFKDKNVKLFTEKDGLPSDRVQSICEDYEGNLWIGTLSGGVCMFKDESVVSFNVKHGLRNNKIYAVCKTSTGKVLVGTFMGVDVYDGTSFRALSEIKELQNLAISSLFEDSRQRVWVCTESEGVFVLEQTGNGFKLIKKFNDIGDEKCAQGVKVIEDSEGNVWIACYGHYVFKFDKALNPSIYGEKAGLTSKNVLAMYQDVHGTIWFGTTIDGVYKLNNGKITKVESRLVSAINNVYSICGDEKGTIFFGSGDGGLVLYYNNTFVPFTTKNGICSNLINAMVYVNGALWLGTDKGVNKVEFESDHRIKNIAYYGVEKGFVNPEISLNSMVAEKNGGIWFGTVEGLIKYNPEYDYKNNTPPKLILMDVKLFYEHVDWHAFSKNISPSNDLPIQPVLSYKNNHLTFVYQATTTDLVKYRFMLEGDNDQWSPLTSKNEAVFTNIAPGKYTFKLQAQNSNGVWSDGIVEFPFEITPPFWKTWWFYSMCVIVVTAGVILFIRMRMAKLQNEKKILEQKVEERTTELKVANHKLFDALHDIKDSINYAERIQRAMLPSDETIHQFLPTSFILFRPRDVVSGDFYWYNHRDGIDYIAAVDCTGHGVPGAFMSMVGSSLLNEIVISKNNSNPSEVLKQLNRGVQKALKQRENNTRDGMDMAFCAIDLRNKKLHYAGANRALWIIRNSSGGNEVDEIKPTKCAIGGFTEEDQHYETHEIQLNSGDTIYMSSDGYADQFGGDRGKKLMTKRFKEILISIQHLDMKQQGRALDFEITDWMGTQFEQVDDMLVIGVKF